MTDVILDLLVRSTWFMTHALALLATVAMVFGGLLAAYVSWHLTDRVIAWRERAD
ncbi:MAG TPA: hypothetical protein VE465_24110 [Streptosporangiaceae bacterium]|nr:hypothetical protein [Streptosporangiaceae bacterium]